MNTILKFIDVNLAYHTDFGEIPVLSHISFEVYEGEFIAIVGPSGCGKSTLLNITAGLLKPESGTIYFHSRPIQDTYSSCSSIGYMLQKDHLFEWRTIFRNSFLGCELQKKSNDISKRHVQQMLSDYGLSDFSAVHPSSLSGGMRQRAALIRTLALSPDLLLLDEPFSALDYQTRLNVSEDIGKIIKKESKTAILVTHDIAEAISMADRILVLSKRPATIQRIVPIALDIKDRTPLSSRNAPEFHSYFNLIWEELNHDT